MRNPGFYWMLEGDKRVPVEWTGKEWWGIAMQRPMSDDEIVDPIPAHPVDGVEPIGSTFDCVASPKGGYHIEARVDKPLPDGTKLYTTPVAAQTDDGTVESLSYIRGLEDGIKPAQPAASVEPKLWLVEGRQSKRTLVVAPYTSEAVAKQRAASLRDATITPLYAAPVAAQPSVPPIVAHVLEQVWEWTTGEGRPPSWEDVDDARRAIGAFPTPPAPEPTTLPDHPTPAEEEAWRQMEAAQARADRIFNAAKK